MWDIDVSVAQVAGFAEHLTGTDAGPEDVVRLTQVGDHGDVRAEVVTDGGTGLVVDSVTLDAGGEAI
jgi:hypothetical protein